MYRQLRRAGEGDPEVEIGVQEPTLGNCLSTTPFISPESLLPLVLPDTAPESDAF